MQTFFLNSVKLDFYRFLSANECLYFQVYIGKMANAYIFSFLSANVYSFRCMSGISSVLGLLSVNVFRFIKVTVIRIISVNVFRFISANSRTVRCCWRTWTNSAIPSRPPSNCLRSTHHVRSKVPFVQENISQLPGPP